ncbi:MAG: DUF488 domain-containing protein [Bacteroidetes bacterium]|nr:DUF488 domain-containing protein [Bacteroidota bacterium]
MPVIYTIGHSTHTLEEFIAMLSAFEITLLADVRSFPASRKNPQFNKEHLSAALNAQGIEYIHFKELGGRRKVQKNSRNTRWRNDSFRAYADYMESENFLRAIALLEERAAQKKTAYMCSEAVWWRCHRSLISDFLKAKGWNVLHIMGMEKVQEHPYTSLARVVGEHVYYFDENLFEQAP